MKEEKNSTKEALNRTAFAQFCLCPGVVLQKRWEGRGGREAFLLA